MSGHAPRNQFVAANQYFLLKRLARVPYEVLESYFSSHLDISKKISQKKLIDELLMNLTIFGEEHDFVKAFSNFFRDYVLSAKESQYILQISKSDDVLEWIKSWKDNKFNGQKYDFELNICVQLEEKILFAESDSVSFPTHVAFLIAKSHRVAIIPNGNELVEIHPTKEFELVFRQNQRLLEVRGDFQVIQDFINTSVDEFNNPLKSAASIAIGDVSDEMRKRAIITPARLVKIDKLKAALDGVYTSASSKMPGSCTPRVTLEFVETGISDFSQETDTLLRDVAEKVLKDPDKGKISFSYNKKRYSFGITKSGGLTFMKYTPEEVVTYILQKIQSL
jgi:hypothetical protein